MSHHITYFTKTFFLATCMALGCSSSGALGCGSSGGAPKVDSNLLGVYQIDRYQGSEDGCVQVMDIDGAPQYLVLYSFLSNDDPEKPRLGGAFCTTVDICSQIAQQAPEPTLGYSFIQGDDQSGWLGWAISGAGGIGDQCRAEVQVHTLTSTAAEAIRIETKTVETTFPPTLDGTVATCRNRDALASLNDSLPCQALLLLEATLETR